MYDNEEKLIWEHYLKEADFSHGSFKGDPDVEPMARMSAHDFGEERPDDLDNNMDLLDMSDAELVHAAHQAGVEDTIVFDGEGDIANNDEVVDAIRGDSAGDELSRIPDGKGFEWEESVENLELNSDQMDTASVRVVQPVTEIAPAVAAGLAAAGTAAATAAGAAAGKNIADRLTKKKSSKGEEEEVEEAKKPYSPLDGDRPKEGTPEGEEYETRHITPGPERERELERRKEARENKPKEEASDSNKQQELPLTGEKNPPKKPKEPTADERAGEGQGRWQKRFRKNVEETHNPNLNPDQMDTAGVRIVKQEGCGSDPVHGKLRPKRKLIKKMKAKMPSGAMSKIKKLMGF